MIVWIMGALPGRLVGFGTFVAGGLSCGGLVAGGLGGGFVGTGFCGDVDEVSFFGRFVAVGGRGVDDGDAVGVMDCVTVAVNVKVRMAVAEGREVIVAVGGFVAVLT